MTSPWLSRRRTRLIFALVGALHLVLSYVLLPIQAWAFWSFDPHAYLVPDAHGPGVTWTLYLLAILPIWAAIVLRTYQIGYPLLLIVGVWVGGEVLGNGVPFGDAGVWFLFWLVLLIGRGATYRRFFWQGGHRA
jgi:hypothetical protein